MNQAGTAQYVTTPAHHTYDFSSDATLLGVAGVRQQFDKPTWGSEICCSTGINGGYGDIYDPTTTGALAMSSIVHHDLTVADDSAFHWRTTLSKVTGCSPGSTPDCATRTNTSGYNDGLICYDPDFAAEHPPDQAVLRARPAQPVRPAGKGTVVKTHGCNGGANQKWTLGATGAVTGTQSGLCLDVQGASTADGTPVVLWTSGGVTTQQWRRSV
ncbi:MAG: RICIN domain-containing protein [Umezawaea sp.]